MRQRGLAACIAIVVVASACGTAAPATSPTSDAPPTTTAAPTDTPTLTTTAALETQPPIVAVGDGPLYLRPIDPVTLKDVVDGTHLGVGGSLWSAVSPNGRWLAATGFATTEGDEPAALLVELDGWAGSDLRPMPAMTALESLAVTDSGTILWLSSALSGWRLHRLEPGAEEPSLVTRVDSGLVPLVDPDEMGAVTDDYVAIVGQMDNDPYGGELTVVIVDLATSRVVEVPLPGVWGGDVEDDDGDLIVRMVSPGWAFDRDRGLLYVVSALADEVLVIDVEAHELVGRGSFDEAGSLMKRVLEWWVPPADAKFGEGLRREVAVSPDGSRLYVATSRAEYDGGRWQDVPLGLEAIDTESMRVVSRTELPIGSVAVSPDGDALIGVGVHERFSAGADESVGSGAYLLDPATLEIRHHLNDGAALVVDGFARDGPLAYLWAHDPVVDQLAYVVIDLDVGEIVGSRTVSWPGYVLGPAASVVDRRSG